MKWIVRIYASRKRNAKKINQIIFNSYWEALEEKQSIDSIYRVTIQKITD